MRTASPTRSRNRKNDPEGSYTSPGPRPVTATVTTPSSSAPPAASTSCLSQFWSKLSHHEKNLQIDMNDVKNLFSWSLLEELLQVPEDFCVALSLMARDKAFFAAVAGRPLWLAELSRLGKGFSNGRTKHVADPCGKLAALCRRVLAEICLASKEQEEFGLGSLSEENGSEVLLGDLSQRSVFGLQADSIKNGQLGNLRGQERSFGSFGRSAELAIGGTKVGFSDDHSDNGSSISF